MKTLIEQLVNAASTSPEKVAFQDSTKKLTYAELLEWSRGFSEFLDVQGIKHQESVAILMPRCLETSVAVYGTMYGGRIWIPIDPTSPVEVVRQLLEDCHIRVLVTHPMMQHLVNSVTESGVPLTSIIGLDSHPIKTPNAAIISWEQVLRCPTVSQAPQASHEDTAYVIHTSGTTGRPKGIVHTHSSATSYARLCVNAFSLSSDDVIGSHGPLHTDMCTFGFLAAPMAGATTQIVPDAHTKIPASMSSLIEKSGITVWYSVPQAIVQILNHGALDTRNFSQLRWVIYAGEAMNPKSIRQLLKHIPNAQVCNVYGPAETNQCMHHVVQNDDQLKALEEQNQQIPIGNTWPETYALLLDDNDNVVDTNNVIGELVIHSSTLMQGYWHDSRPDTQIYFEYPVDRKRYYRTGDLAQRDQSGVYSLVGRRGRQVKVRGMRIELDSIELQLSQHPLVVDAIALFHNPSTDPGKGVIRAIVTLSDKCDSASLQEFVRSRMPIHAVPESIQIRSSLPLTSGGKVDRLRLSNEIRSIPTETATTSC